MAHNWNYSCPLMSAVINAIFYYDYTKFIYLRYYSSFTLKQENIISKQTLKDTNNYIN